MAQLEKLSDADEPMGPGVSFTEVQALGAAQQVDLFRRSHRRAVWSRYAEVVALTAIDASRAYESHGCSSIQQFGAKFADYSKRKVRDLLRVGRKLRGCPELDAAFRSERLSWSRVRALVPVVTHENSTRWIETAMRISTASLEHMVGRQREPYGLPGMAPMPEVASGALAAFRELCARLRQRLGQPGMPDSECAEILFAMAGWALEQHAEEALCASGYAEAATCEKAPAEAAVTHVRRESSADPQVTDIDAPCCADPSTGRSRHIPKELRRSALRRANYRCQASGCSSSHALELHHIEHFAHGGDHTADNLIVWCHACHELWHRSMASDKSDES